MFNDICRFLINFLDGLVFTSWADTLLTTFQVWIVKLNAVTSELNIIVSSFRVVTYFVPVQHLAFMIDLIGGYMALKMAISFYRLINPFK